MVIGPRVLGRARPRTTRSVSGSTWLGHANSSKLPVPHTGAPLINPTPARVAAQPQPRIRSSSTTCKSSLSQAPSAQPPQAPSPPQQPEWNLGAAVPAVPYASESVDLPYYSQYPLDRRADWRRNDKLLNELLQRPDARIIPLLRDKVLTAPAQPTPPTSATHTPAGPLLHPVLLSPASAALAAGHVSEAPARIFLGTDASGAPYFAAAVPSTDAAAKLAEQHPGSEWRSARLAGPDLAPGDASLLGVASGLMVWHGSNTHSASTGAATVPRAGGFSRGCTAGGGSSYPRTDPAVIMQVGTAAGAGMHVWRAGKE